MERYMGESDEENRNNSDSSLIEKQIIEYFSDSESNPKKHSVQKISEREYQVGSFLLYPVLYKGRVMLTTPTGNMSLYEFYQKNLNKDIDASADKLISDEKEDNQHFIFSGQQFELSNEVEENSRSIHSQFKIPEEEEEDKIEFQIEDDDTRQQRISFIESIGSDDSYIISTNSKHKKSPSNDFAYIGESGEKEIEPTGSPLMNKNN